MALLQIFQDKSLLSCWKAPSGKEYRPSAKGRVKGRGSVLFILERRTGLLSWGGVY
jgi:hypothetical protein